MEYQLKDIFNKLAHVLMTTKKLWTKAMTKARQCQNDDNDKDKSQRQD